MESDAKMKGNFAGGENVGSSWTDKIMGMKSSQPSDDNQTEGVDEDEWVCSFVHSNQNFLILSFF